MSKGLLLWVLIGAGVILLYSAYKGKSPKAIVTGITDTVKG